jgi:hypothetical protein
MNLRLSGVVGTRSPYTAKAPDLKSVILYRIQGVESDDSQSGVANPDLVTNLHAISTTEGRRVKPHGDSDMDCAEMQLAPAALGCSPSHYQAWPDCTQL